MLYIFIALVLFFMLAVVITQQLKHREEVEKLQLLIEDQDAIIIRKTEEYEALETGMDELEEALEMDLLGLREMLGTHMLALYSAEEEVAKHRQNCLLDLNEMRAANA